MQITSKRGIQLGLVTIVLAFLFTATVSAGQGYYVIDKSVRSGMLVSLNQNPGVVEPASDKNAASLVGVIGNAQTDFDVSKDQVSVQTDGTVNTLVSTVAGDIKVGDHIAPSSVVGFGAKAGDSGWAVGIAQGSLDASTKGAVKSVVTDSAGLKHDVYVANIPVQIHVVHLSTDQPPVATAIPNKIQSLADSIAGKRVSQIAIVLGSLVLIAGFIIAGIIVNAAVRNGISSIARQPLARQEIVRRMLQSFGMATGILGVALVVTVVIIRLL